MVRFSVDILYLYMIMIIIILLRFKSNVFLPTTVYLLAMCNSVWLTLSTTSYQPGTVTRDRDNHVRFGLSVEEMGLLLHQLPLQQAVSLVRKPAPSEAMYDSNTSTPHKVCTITPQDNQGGMVEWKVDYEIDGVGGQHISNNATMQLPMAVMMQAGEVQVVLEILRHSLPVLAGWTFAQNIAMQKAMNEAVRGGGYGGGGGGGGPPPANDPYGF